MCKYVVIYTLYYTQKVQYTKVGYSMKQDYSDRILKEFDEHPIKSKLWADTKFFYLQYIWHILHPLQNHQLKKLATPQDIMLKQIKARLRQKELLQKYEHLTNEQLDRIYQLFDDNDTDS